MQIPFSLDRQNEEMHKVQHGTLFLSLFSLWSESVIDDVIRGRSREAVSWLSESLLILALFPPSFDLSLRPDHFRLPLPLPPFSSSRFPSPTLILITFNFCFGNIGCYIFWSQLSRITICFIIILFQRLPQFNFSFSGIILGKLIGFHRDLQNYKASDSMRFKVEKNTCNLDKKPN